MRCCGPSSGDFVPAVGQFLGSAAGLPHELTLTHRLM